MRSPEQAGGDGSLGRSAGTAAAKGAALLLVAVVLGVVLLQAADDGDPFARRVATARTAKKPTTAGAPAPTTSSTTPTTTTRPPEQVKVLAANGTNTGGLAGRVTEMVKFGRFNTLAATDASRKGVRTSVVYFAPGYEPEARQIAQILKLAPTAAQAMPAQPPVGDTRGANVLVLVGADLVATAAPARSTSSTSSTSTPTG